MHIPSSHNKRINSFIIAYEACFKVTKVDEDIIEINEMKKEKGKR